MITILSKNISKNFITELIPKPILFLNQ